MASVIFDINNPSNDPWELLYLAGGNPLQNTYDPSTTTLANPSVTQAALDQALVDFNNGVQSTQKQLEVKETAEETVTPTDLALAILGDQVSITQLQTLVGVTSPNTALPSIPPTSPSTNLKNNYSATVDPTTTDDSNANYGVGSVWINTSTNLIFICVDNTIGNAIWLSVSSGGGSAPANNYGAASAPTTAGTGSNAGYSVGSTWITTTGDIYICTAITATTGTWHQVDSSINNNFSATSAPPSGTPSVPYSVGSMWYDTTAHDFYIAIATGWVKVSDDTLNNHNSTVDPTAADDANSGYSIGSIWINKTSKSTFVCVDSIVNAAVWNQIDASIKNNSAVIPPTINDDISLGYSIGSIWVNTANGISYICTSSAPANAKWIPINKIINRFAATIVGGTFTTLMTNIPFVNHPSMTPSGFSNIGGVITSLNGGDYTISCTLPFTTTRKDKLHSIQIIHNNVLASPVYTVSSGKKKSSVLNISKFPISLLPNDTISIQQLGVNGSTYSAHLIIEPWGV